MRIYISVLLCSCRYYKMCTWWIMKFQYWIDNLCDNGFFRTVYCKTDDELLYYNVLGRGQINLTWPIDTGLELKRWEKRNGLKVVNGQTEATRFSHCRIDVESEIPPEDWIEFQLRARQPIHRCDMLCFIIESQRTQKRAYTTLLLRPNISPRIQQCS